MSYRIVTHLINNTKIAEIESESIVIRSSHDGLDLLTDLYYQEFDAIILQAASITPDFFTLHNGMAGEILQKFSNFRMRLAIVGDFTSTGSKSLHSFVIESNRLGNINFVGSLQEAFAKLTRT